MISSKQSREPQPVNSDVSILDDVQQEIITLRLCPYEKILARVQC